MSAASPWPGTSPPPCLAHFGRHYRVSMLCTARDPAWVPAWVSRVERRFEDEAQEFWLDTAGSDASGDCRDSSRGGAGVGAAGRYYGAVGAACRSQLAADACG